LSNSLSAHLAKTSLFSLINSAVITALPAFTAECRAAAAPSLLGAWHLSMSIDISCMHGAQQHTCSLQHVAAALLRSSDGQTDTRPFHTPSSACYAGSANNIERL